MAYEGEYSKTSKLFNLNRSELLITSDFGWRTHPITGEKDTFHTGTDYSIAENSNLTSPFYGEVTGVQMGFNGGYGGTALIYNFILDITYANNHMNSASVSVGDYVNNNTVLGLSGGKKGHANAGTSTGAHLHAMLIKGRHTRVPANNESNRHLFIDVETFDFGGGGVDPVTPSKKIFVDIGHMDIGGNMKKGQTYEITEVNGKEVVMELLKNEYGQMVFKDDRIEFSYYYKTPDSTEAFKPKQTRNGGRGYGRVTEILSDVENPYKVYTDGKFLGYVKPVNTYQTY